MQKVRKERIIKLIDKLNEELIIQKHTFLYKYISNVRIDILSEKTDELQCIMYETSEECHTSLEAIFLFLLLAKKFNSIIKE